MFLIVILYMVFSFSFVAYKYQTLFYFRLGIFIQKILSAVHGIIVATNIFLFFAITYVDINTLSIPLFFRAIGFLLFAFGSYLLVWAALLLRVSLIHPGQKDTLITSGPFQWSRHPMYVGGILGAFGISFLYASLFALIYSMLQIIVLYSLAVTEELDLKHRFGQAYEDYARKTPRLLPAPRIFKRK